MKQLLIGISNADELESFSEYYTDGTWRCHHWPVNDISQWKIEDGRMWFRHHGEVDWAIHTPDRATKLVMVAFEAFLNRTVEEAIFSGKIDP